MIKTENVGFEPAAVVTVGEDGQISGMVFGTNGDKISVTSNQHDAAGVDVTEMKPNTAVNHGTHSPHTAHAASDHDHHASSAPSGVRSRRAEEPWFGNDTCYTNDNVTRSVKMGLALTKEMYDGLGGTDSGADFFIADTLAKTNLVSPR